MGSCCQANANDNASYQSKNKDSIKTIPLVLSPNIWPSDPLIAPVQKIVENEDITKIIFLYLPALELTKDPFSDAFQYYYCHAHLLSNLVPFVELRNFGRSKQKALQIAVIGDDYADPDQNIVQKLFNNYFESSYDPYITSEEYSVQFIMTDDDPPKFVKSQLKYNQEPTLNVRISTEKLVQFKGKLPKRKTRERPKRQRILDKEFIDCSLNVYAANDCDIFIIHICESFQDSINNGKLIHECIKAHEKLKHKLCFVVSTRDGEPDRIGSDLIMFCRDNETCYVSNIGWVNHNVLEMFGLVLKEFWYKYI